MQETTPPIGHGLEEDAGGGYPLGVCHEAVCKMATVRQILSHDSVVGVQQTCKN